MEKQSPISKILDVDTALITLEYAFRDAASSSDLSELRGITRFYLSGLELLDTFATMMQRTGNDIKQAKAKMRSILEALEQHSQEELHDMEHQRQAFQKKAYTAGLLSNEGTFILDLGPTGSVRINRDKNIIRKLANIAEQTGADVLEALVAHPDSLKSGNEVFWRRPHHVDNEGEGWVTLGDWLKNKP